MKKVITNITVFLFAFVLSAQNINVQISVQIPIFTKILSFERSISENSNPNIVIGVVYQKFAYSKQSKDAVIEAFSKNSYSGKKRISVKEIEANTISDLSNGITNNKPDVILLVPLRSIEIEKVLELTKKNHILSMTLCPEYVTKNKVSVAIDVQGDKPQILINLNTSKAEGADFSSQLLKLSKIVY